MNSIIDLFTSGFTLTLQGPEVFMIPWTFQKLNPCFKFSVGAYLACIYNGWIRHDNMMATAPRLQNHSNILWSVKYYLIKLDSLISLWKINLIF